MKQLGKRITTLRKNRNLSQEALAEQVGVSRQAISKWERDEALPDIYNLTTLAEIFGLTLDELLKGSDEAGASKKPMLLALELKLQAEKYIMAGIAMLILGAFVFIIEPLSHQIQIIICVFMALGGILIIIKAGFMFERFYMLNKQALEASEESGVTRGKRNKKRQDALATIAALSCTLAFLYLGFFKGMWHPGWMVYLLIPIVLAIGDLIASR